MGKSKKQTTEIVTTELVVAKEPKALPQMTKVSARSVSIQPRTAMIAIPAFFYLEPKSAKRVADEGNAVDDIKVYHQVDPNRTSSCAPVMPCSRLLAETGNAYPNAEDHPSVKSDKTWSKYVKLSNSVFSLLREHSEAGRSVTAAELLDEAIAASGVGKTKNGTIASDAMSVVSDTLRDLRLYGFAVSEDATSLGKKTKYTLAAGYDNIQSVEDLEKIAA